MAAAALAPSIGCLRGKHGETRVVASTPMMQDNSGIREIIWLVGWAAKADEAARAIRDRLGATRIDLASLVNELSPAAADHLEALRDVLVARLHAADSHVLLDATPLGDERQRLLVSAKTLASIPSTAVVVLCAPEGTPVSSSQASRLVSAHAMAESIPTCFVPYGSTDVAVEWISNATRTRGDTPLPEDGWPA